MYPIIKRCIDIVGAGLGLIVLSPVLAVVAVTIWMQMGRPIFFKQIRPGYKGKPFEMVKFCTMSSKRDDKGNLLPDEQRLTSLGKFLRKTSLDEHSFEDKRFAIVPIGGCGNLKHWKTLKLAEQFNLPWCILLDSDKGTPEETKNAEAVQQLRKDGIKAYVTRKREPENYIH